MIDTINIIAALVTLALGGFGFLAPRYTAGVLDLTTDGSNMGLSELRASAGGLFVGLSVACLVLGAPLAYAMLGFAYLGAAAGRTISLAMDSPPMRKAALYLLFEIVFAGWLIFANMPLV
ncbi:DUF4345 family protein [Marivita sp. GX14005]|uniref:DUF4345 family protein n=1 Tax=Marivita sp. GX14005 TaxID=2942276 RepID=UPI0020198A1D|nr:DUF4345 family protein [Marivita sp. GX14005]MCL3882464.1 DUF4345 family protein [Marivita sp. GX14005]